MTLLEFFIKIFVLVAAVLLLLLLISLPWFIHQDNLRTDRADALAASQGCVNLGSARNIGTVKFFDCNGEIRLVKVE